VSTFIDSLLDQFDDENVARLATMLEKASSSG
jgi:hypothetical protein